MSLNPSAWDSRPIDAHRSGIAFPARRIINIFIWRSCSPILTGQRQGDLLIAKLDAV